MSGVEGASARFIDEDAALRAIVEGTASETGRGFYRALVRALATALGTYGAWLTEFDGVENRLRALAFWMDGRFIDTFEYEVAGTPCETTLREGRLVHIPDRVLELYPDDPVEFPERVVSYLGIPLFETDGRLLGHLAVVDVRPMREDQGLVTLFRLFATRALAEMRRLRLEEELRERQEKLERLIGSAMDAIVEVDGDLRVTLVNAAAEKAFGAAAAGARGRPLEVLLGAAAARQVGALAEVLEQRTGEGRSLWIPDGLEARPQGARAFQAEATLSRFEVSRRPYYALILRDVDERLEAERAIRSLTATAAYLADRLAEERGFGEIVGRSPAMQEARRAVGQVAPTGTSVLILGETGTGKELFARAIHERSPRRERPLVKVNCAAIPAALIESEFFGHERGAFTGATQRREGRFTLADGGTLFLDEVGDLPLELQGKLLRALQEGEFEPVGGSRTHKVDVRVVAATNRDLEQAVRQGTFRADLYYRLGVFPLRLPPLRERGDDVVALARAMAASLARSLGRAVAPLDALDEAALTAYPWPGNVRELRNVLERAIITSPDGRLRLAAVLPAPPPVAPATDGPRRAGEILSERSLRQLERDNTLAALAACGWRVEGEGGAARLLGVRPSTLKSRMKALGLQRAPTDAAGGGARAPEPPPGAA